MSCSAARRARRDKMNAIRQQIDEHNRAVCNRERDLLMRVYVPLVLRYRESPTDAIRSVVDDLLFQWGTTYLDRVEWEHLLKLMMRSHSHEKAFRKALAYAIGCPSFVDSNIYIAALDSKV